MKKPNVAGVVSRLRLVLLAIALVVVGAAIVFVYQLYGLTRSQETLVGNSVPSLVQSQRLVRLLSDNLVLSGRLETADSNAKIQALDGQLRANIGALSASVDQAKVAHQDSAPELGLKAGLIKLQNSVDRMVARRQALVARRERVQAYQAQLLEFQTRIGDLTEPVEIDSASQLESELAAYSGAGRHQQNFVSSRIAALLESSHRAREINFLLLRTIGMARQLSVEAEQGLIAGVEARMKFNLRNATQLLIRLEPADIRRKLALESRQLRSILFTAQGLVQSVRSYQVFNSQFLLEQSLQRDVITAISDSIDSVVAEAQRSTAFQSAAFEKRLGRTISFLVFATLLVVAIIGTVLYLIVEKQINRRMTRLTDAVLEIAGGNHTRDVDVYGRDELASMAKALKVFKTNARELVRSNEELEKFAYAASHDLRSPLRAIENLVEWTLEDGEGKLPEDSVENLEKVLERTRRLSDLQTGLLEYAQVGKAPVKLESVNLQVMLDELTDLLDAQGKYPVSLVCPRAVVVSYLIPLRQILMNLISNAIKHHDRPSGHIKMEVDYRNARLWFTVTDDGPGIAPSFHERIFGLFQTLQPRDVVEGSGLGLSLIRKQVEHFEGRITVRSDPALRRGTAFQFDFPGQLVDS